MQGKGRKMAAKPTPIKAFVQNLGQKMGLKKRPRLVEFSQLADFVGQNAAFVSQVALYTYVKARAGTSFPKLFENEKFVQSLHIARWHIFAASVVDLALFSAGELHTKAEANVADNDSLAVARYLGESALATIDQNDVPVTVFYEALAGLEKRAAAIRQLESATTTIHPSKATPFSGSADAFLRWAPMADEFKRDDEEIMRNSIEMRWIEVRRELRARLDGAAVYRDWLRLADEGRHAG